MLGMRHSDAPLPDLLFIPLLVCFSITGEDHIWGSSSTGFKCEGTFLCGVRYIGRECVRFGGCGQEDRVESQREGCEVGGVRNAGISGWS